MKYSKTLLSYASDQIAKRFWNLVSIGNSNECWPWIGMRDRYGYGQFKLAQGARVTASRFAFVLANKQEPAAGHVCHDCDNPICCNPGHLTLGSAKTNHEDKAKKGRARGRFSPKVQKEPVAPVHERLVTP